MASEGRLSETELAHRWHISRRSLQRWRRAGKCPPYTQIGRQLFFSLKDVTAFEKRCRVDPSSSPDEPR